MYIMPVKGHFEWAILAVVLVEGRLNQRNGEKSGLESLLIK